MNAVAYDVPLVLVTYSAEMGTLNSVPMTVTSYTIPQIVVFR